MDCDRAHERIVGAGYVDVKWTELLKGEDPTARSCDGRDEHSGAIRAHLLIKRLTTNH